MTTPSSAATYDVERLRREQFPVSQEAIYLNHAGISPLPVRTQNKVRQVLDDMARNPTGFFEQAAIPLFENFGSQVADFISAEDPLSVVQIASTSTGLNLVANAIDWQPGDQIILATVEFPSNAYPWLQLRQHGVEVTLVEPQHGTLTVERLAETVTERTRLVAVSSVQFFTGARADLQALGDFCHTRQILFAVDAIQSIGHTPIDVQAMHIDILATGGQKSIMALPGSGFLYVRRELVETMQPANIGPNATVGWEHWLDYDLTPREGALRFMQGTMSIEGMFSVVESLTFLDELGREGIDAHTTALTGRFIDALQALDMTIITPPDPAWRGPIVTFRPNTDPATTVPRLHDKLKAAGVMLAQHLDQAGTPHLRVAVHCYNNEEDQRQFIALLSKFIEDIRS